ncbi:Ig-like domain (group 2) [Lachnospiraceae bacterium]|nr:Ig-like domain (group 2) [Lachnospiraceae bacterium]
MKITKKLTCFLLTLVMAVSVTCPAAAGEKSETANNISSIVKYVKKNGKSTSDGNKYVNCNWDKKNDHGYSTQLIYISKSNILNFRLTIVESDGKSIISTSGMRFNTEKGKLIDTYYNPRIYGKVASVSGKIKKPGSFHMGDSIDYKVDLNKTGETEKDLAYYAKTNEPNRFNYLEDTLQQLFGWDITSVGFKEYYQSKAYVAGDKGIDVKSLMAVASGSDVKYSSSDSEVVKVTKEGTISCKKPGTAKITAKKNKSVIGSCMISVEKPEVAEKLSLAKGSTLHFNEIVVNADEMKNKPDSVTSSDEDKVVVDSKGDITAKKKKGSATITIKYGKAEYTSKIKLTEDDS